MSVSAPRALVLAVGCAMLAAASPVRGETGSVVVVPSRPGIPVPINGRDASWSVVEGDIGLARPGHLTPVIVGGGRPLPPRWSYHGRPYYPSYGVAPQRGRHEIEPGPERMAPEPAESFSRSWSTSSEPQYSEHREPHEPRRPHRSPQSYNVEGEHLPPTIENPAALLPPIVVVPRGRRP